VADWAGEGTEGETLALSKSCTENDYILLLLSFCKKSRGNRRWFICLSFPYYYLTSYLIISKIKEMFYQTNLTKYIKDIEEKIKKGCNIIVLRIELLILGIAM
jgi:hypothetical protein